jgi:hypothetical protein
MFTELIQFVLNNTVRYLVINQTTRVSNGTVKMAILLEICKQRGTQLVIARQYGVSPMSISKADQLRIEHRNGMCTSFRATIAKLSNNSSRLVQSFLGKAWNEHCRLPAKSLLQKSLIESDEMARQNRLIKRAETQAKKRLIKRAETQAKKKAADEIAAAIRCAERAEKQAAKKAADEMARQNRLIERAKEQAAKKAADEERATFNRAERAKKQAAKKAADLERAAFNCAERDKEQAAKLASYKLEAENTLAKLASYKRAEEKERVAAAKEAAKQLAAMTNRTVDSKWVDMFEVLVRHIKETRETATWHMNDEQKAEWIWDGHVPCSYKTPCGKALGKWIHRQRTAKAKDILKVDRELQLTSICLRWKMSNAGS